MRKRLILLGGGGHCKSCIDVIEAEGKYIIEGILDTNDKTGGEVLGYPILGDESLLDEYIRNGCYFLVTVGQIKSPHLRKKLFNLLQEKDASIATVVAPSATLSQHARVGKGTIVMHGVRVNAGAVVGNNVILNTGCLVEHDASVADHVHISTHAILNGEAQVGTDCFIGSNAVISQGRRVQSGTVVGAGSVVVRDLEEAGVYVGNPAKKI